MHNFKQCTRITLLALLTSLSISHCHAQVNGDKVPSASPSQSQVVPSNARIVAKVGDRQITLADLHRATASALRGITDPAIITRIQAQALQELINEYAAADAFAADAVSQKKEVIEQVERLQRQVIMNYYLSIHASTIPNPDPQKIARFLQQHPELVSGRQMFHFNQIVIQASTESQQDEVKALVQADPSLAKLRAWLIANRVPSEGNKPVAGHRSTQSRYG